MSEVIVRNDGAIYKTFLTNDRHKLIADEPLSQGSDLGPTPYEYLLMSLGSCIAITMRMYANRKKWDLQDVEVRLSQERVHHEDCEDCESNKGYVHVIHKKIKMTGDLDADQRKRMMEIADRCPVNKTLLNEIKIRSEEIE